LPGKVFRVACLAGVVAICEVEGEEVDEVELEMTLFEGELAATALDEGGGRAGETRTGAAEEVATTAASVGPADTEDAPPEDDSADVVEEEEAEEAGVEVEAAAELAPPEAPDGAAELAPPEARDGVAAATGVPEDVRCDCGRGDRPGC
jgi:hypothetical protein